jgi:threonine/homoserine/homoserine lactone efflux protein
MFRPALVFVAMTFAVFLVCAATVATARDTAICRPAVMRWLRRPFASASSALGLRLRLAEG